MRTSRIFCRQKCTSGRGYGVACIALLLVGGMVLNIWAVAFPLQIITLQHLPDVPLLSASPALQLPVATLEEGGKPKCFVKAFQRLSARFDHYRPVRPFRCSRAGGGPVVSTGIGPFLHPARQLVLLHVDLPPPANPTFYLP